MDHFENKVMQGDAATVTVQETGGYLHQCPRQAMDSPVSNVFPELHH